MTTPAGEDVGDLRKDPKLTARCAVGGNWVCSRADGPARYVTAGGTVNPGGLAP